MAVKYRHYQQKNGIATSRGKWYVRAVHDETITLDDMAEKIQRNSTAKKSDVLAVITEMMEVIKDELQASKRVRLDGIGTFKIAVYSKPADDLDKFTVQEHIKGFKVLFAPERKGKQVELLRGLTIKEAGKYSI